MIWVSGEEATTVTLTDGKYKLHELTAPEGYQVATDMTFEIEDGKLVKINGNDVDTDTVVMIDEAIITTPTTTTKSNNNHNHNHNHNHNYNHNDYNINNNDNSSNSSCKDSKAGRIRRRGKGTDTYGDSARQQVIILKDGIGAGRKGSYQRIRRLSDLGIRRRGNNSYTDRRQVQQHTLTFEIERGQAGQDQRK